MKIAALIFISIIFLFLQVVSLGKLSFGEISPDFPLLICTFLALYKGTLRGSIIGFVIGFTQDLFNPELLGLNALTKSIVGYTFGHVGKKTVPEGVLFLAAVFFFGALGHDFIYLLFFTSLDLGKFFIMFISIALPSALYTTVFGVAGHKILLLVSSRMVKAFGKAR